MNVAGLGMLMGVTTVKGRVEVDEGEYESGSISERGREVPFRG